MDEVFLRFYHLGRKIFEILDGQDLSNCMQVSRKWKKFITDENLHILCMIQMYNGCSKTNSRQVLKKTDLKTLVSNVNECFDMIQKNTGCSKAKLRQVLKKTDLKTLVRDMNKLDNGVLSFQPPGHNLLFRTRDLTLFHMAAAKGQLTLSELIIENAEDKNPKSKIRPPDRNIEFLNDGYEMTPLHLAANNGHFEICKLILEMIDNKNPKSGMALEGMTPLDMAKERGHMNIFMLIKSAIGHKTAEYFN